MKVRLTDSSIRFRITQEELNLLKEEKTVEVSAVFSPMDRMNIRLLSWHPDVPGYRNEAGTWSFFVPSATLSEIRDENGYSGLIRDETRGEFRMMVEVDLPCKH